MFHIVPTSDIRGTITEAYACGGPHVEKYLRTAGQGLAACIEGEISELSSQPTLKLYKVVSDHGELVGYFGEEHDGLWLSTYFIVSKYRPCKTDFWNVVVSKMNETFSGGAFSKNSPAKKFLEKMGGISFGAVPTKFGPFFLFEFRK